MLKIDAHQHFWKYTAAEYGWIDDEALRRDFLPTDLHKELKAAGIDGAVSVQARQTVEETEWLLSMAGEHPFLKGVVGWLPLTSAQVEGQIEKFAANKKLKALRHVVQDEKDDRYILRDDFNAGVALLDKYGLAYDVLIFERHLPYAIQFVDRHRKQRFVLDHIAKPLIEQGILSPWESGVRALARLPNIYCKLSGMVTEARWRQWREDDFRAYLDVIFNAFGPERVMIGSDWPVCTLSADYGQALGIVIDYIAQLSSEVQEGILGGNCARFYGLG